MRTNHNKPNYPNCPAETVEPAFTYERENRLKWLRRNLKFDQNVSSKNKVEPGYISYLFRKAQKRNQAKHPSRISKRAFEPGKMSLPRSPSTLIFLPFYTDSPPQNLNLHGFFHLHALERAPISLGNSFSINSSPYFPCKLNLLRF